jgi:stage II sporulation protein D
MKTLTTLIAASLVCGTLAPVPLLSGGLPHSSDISQQNKPATIKVLVGKQKDKLILEAKGRYVVYNPLNQLQLTSGSSTKRDVLTSDEYGIKWGELFPGIYQLRLVPKDAKSSILVDGIEYRGCVEIYDLNGRFHIVNEVDIERFLKSTLTAQFPTELDEEVMDSVAIAARTNAYYLVKKNADAYWHVEAQDTGYQGYAVVLQNVHVDRAINNTRNMILTYRGEPFPASWTKDSAGKTADFASIYRKEVQAQTPQGVDSPFAARERDKHAWNFSISKQDLAKALGAARVNDFGVFQDEKTQKIYGARFKDGDQVRKFDFTKLQKALGAAKLKSNDFTVQFNGDQIVFKGHGEGAGVGLCLFSASAMADKGDKAQKILTTFYPNTQLENIPEHEQQKKLVAETKADEADVSLIVDKK